ncbi:hypothetical protein AYI70_g1929 [Smittium culicis]|uniref:Uncharacterized protein n=2 Tax=Smittium culicis TaxID=133412 RepID=A0A1R1YAE5_9FUNG|nr:hypothetical protein AYI70_g1929 [Smittium culicis]
MCDIHSILSEIDDSNLSLSQETLDNEPFNNAEIIDHFDSPQDDNVWFKAFLKCFVHDLNAEHDDMLFFVKKDTSPNSNRIIVSRKPSTPNLFQCPTPPISWMESFYLNLIVQMPCTLTISIFRKQSEDNNSLVKKKEIQKKVYALPNFPQKLNNKSVSEPPLNSYPLIHYIVQDFEDCLDQILLGPHEFFNVELSTFIQFDKSSINIPDIFSPQSTSPSKSLLISNLIPNLNCQQINQNDSTGNNTNNDNFDNIFTSNSEKCGNHPTFTKDDSQNTSILTKKDDFDTHSDDITEKDSEFSQDTNVCVSPTKSANSLVEKFTLKRKKVILYKSWSSYDSLLDSYLTKQKNVNILARIRNTSFNTEFIKIENVKKTGAAQIGLKGTHFTTEQEKSNSPDHLYHKNLKHSQSNPTLNIQVDNTPLITRIIDQKFKSAPSLVLCCDDDKCIKLEVKGSEHSYSYPYEKSKLCSSSEKSQVLSPKLTNIKSHCSILINNQYRRYSSNTSPAEYSINPERLKPIAFNTRKVKPKLGGMCDSLPSPPLVANCTALESLNSHKQVCSTIGSNISNSNKPAKQSDRTFTKWLQKISFPSVVSENFGLSFQNKPGPDSLNVFVNFVYIPWNEIIKDIISAKNSVD